MTSCSLAFGGSLGTADAGTPMLHASCASCSYAAVQNAEAPSRLPMIRLRTGNLSPDLTQAFNAGNHIPCKGCVEVHFGSARTRCR